MDDAVKVPLDRFVREVAREAARTVIEEHVASCPARSKAAELNSRLQRVEVRFAALVAFMAGSGALGGLAGAALAGLLRGG